MSVQGRDPRDGHLGTFGGCETCRARWVGPLALRLIGEPRDLGECVEVQGNILRCGLCGAYWIGDAYHPTTITRDQALGYFPDLDERERRA